MKTVYDAYTRQVMFEGTSDECWDWIMAQAFTFPDGRKIFREWEQDGDHYYDVGSVYIFNE